STSPTRCSRPSASHPSTASRAGCSPAAAGGTASASARWAPTAWRCAATTIARSSATTTRARRSARSRRAWWRARRRCATARLERSRRPASAERRARSSPARRCYPHSSLRRAFPLSGASVIRARRHLLLVAISVALGVAAVAAHAGAVTHPLDVPQWPSVADQLRAGGVHPGSALAALVAANQDFTMLRPGEAKDALPVPPWLRVWWRKGHPEGSHRAGDPTGGYQLVLKEIYEWMRLHQDLQRGPGDEPLGEPDGPTKTTLSGEVRVSGSYGYPR